MKGATESIPSTTWRLAKLLKLGLGPLDQGLFAISNLILVVGVARGSSVAVFGYFSVWYTGFLLLQGLVRANVGMPALLDGRATLRVAGGGVSVILLAATAILLSATIGLVLFDSVAMLFVAATAVAIAADSCRYLSYSASRPLSSILIDGTWLSVQLIGFVAIGAGLAKSLALWACGAVAGTFVWLIRNRDFRELVIIGPRSGVVLLCELGRGKRAALTGETLITSALRQTLNWLSLALFGLAGAAALRGAFTLFGPVMTASLGLRLAVIPQLSAATVEQRRTRAIALGVLTSAVALLVGAVTSIIPPAWGETVLGASWAPTSAIIAPATITFMFWSLDNAGFIFHAAGGHVTRLARTKLFVATAQLSGVLVGALFGDGLVELMYGLSAGSCAGTVIWLNSLRYSGD